MANKPRNSTVLVTSTFFTFFLMGGVYLNSQQYMGQPQSKNLFVKGFKHMSELSPIEVFGWTLTIWVIIFLFISLFVRIGTEVREEG